MRARTSERWPSLLNLPEPEAFHPDLVDQKRRSHALRTLSAAYASGMPLDEAVIHGSDLTAAEVDEFWNELVPTIARERGDWSSLHARADRLHERYGVEALYRLERVLERYAWVLRERILEHPVASAQLHTMHISNFRFHTLLQEILLDGRDALTGMLRDPSGFGARASKTTDATQLWTYALLRYDQLMIHIGSFRYTDLGRYSHDWNMPGLYEYYPFLVRQIPPDEAFLPTAIKHDDGEFTVEGMYPPPRVLAQSSSSTHR
jgi:hypothetical protein